VRVEVSMKRRKFSPEFREEATKMVIETLSLAAYQLPPPREDSTWEPNGLLRV
jgi:hypothetical protein